MRRCCGSSQSCVGPGRCVVNSPRLGSLVAMRNRSYSGRSIYAPDTGSFKDLPICVKSISRGVPRLLRRSYSGRQIWLLLDEAPGHIAAKSQALAEQLDIVLLWLPKQCSELNAMDQLWRDMKSNISANHQYLDIDEHAAFAEAWISLQDKK